MECVRLAILGGGSVRCSPAVVACLASFFGERPLEIRMWDADAERLDLFDLLARTYFTATLATHSLLSTTDPAEALKGADRILVQFDEHCARKYLGPESGEEPVREALGRLFAFAPVSAAILSLLEVGIGIPVDGYRQTDWPGPIPEDNPVSVAHEVLRIIRAEENPYPYLKRHERNPLREWLESVPLRSL